VSFSYGGYVKERVYVPPLTADMNVLYQHDDAVYWRTDKLNELQLKIVKCARQV
jgi:hypothetical protein